MAIKKVDTVRLKETSKNVIYLANRYDILINNLFKKFSDVPYGNGAWVGQTAQKYFKDISFEKADFLEFSEKLREYGKRLSEDAELIETQIYDNARIEKG